MLVADSGQDALEIAEHYEGKIDLLLTDVVMPGMSGRELVKTFQERHGNVRTLYMSGYADDMVARKGMLEEGVGLLPKPFSASQLLERVRDVLEQAHVISEELVTG